MPNWCNTSMSVVLPTRNVEKFKDLFLDHDPEKNESKERYFARSFLNYFEECESNKNGMSLVKADFDCAWSVYCCMFDDSEVSYVNHKSTISLDDAVKELEIQRITGKSYEPGVGFEESITFDINGDERCQCDCRDLYPDPADEMLDEEEEDNSKEFKKDIERIYGKEDKCLT